MNIDEIIFNDDGGTLIDEFECKVKGVTFRNSDGSSRQEALQRCREGMQVRLVHTPTPEHPDSIMIVADGTAIGQVPSEINDYILGGSFDAHIAFLTIVDSFVNDDDEEIWYARIGVRLYNLIEPEPAEVKRLELPPPPAPTPPPIIIAEHPPKPIEPTYWQTCSDEQRFLIVLWSIVGVITLVILSWVALG